MVKLEPKDGGGSQIVLEQLLDAEIRNGTDSFFSASDSNSDQADRVLQLSRLD